jgi:hypothetical protein
MAQLMEHLSAANRMLWAAVLSLALIKAEPASIRALSAEIMSVADGPPGSLIRGTEVFRAAQGVILRPGDLISTGPGTLLILVFKAGAAAVGIVAIGPGSRLYWMDRSDRVTLAIQGGWVKVDTLALAQHVELQAEGPDLGAGSEAGTYVLHVGEGVEEVFQESGSMQLWSRDSEGVRTSASSEPSQFARRSAADPIKTRRGPDAAFVDAMPPPFRDPLPAGLATRQHGSAEPEWVREVAYEDVAEWLAAPRDWRRGFVKRFRPRLKDPAFFHAIDGDLRVRTEWQPILHPHPAVADGPGEPPIK